MLLKQCAAFVGAINASSMLAKNNWILLMKKLIYGALAAVLIVPTSAHAIVSYDFAAMANSSDPGEKGFLSYMLTSTAPG